MILWQKQASPQWLEVNELRLEELAAGNLAVISRPGKTRSLLQIICRHASKAEKLLNRFGGSVRPVPLDWLRQVKPHPPIRIGRKLKILNEPARFAGPTTVAQLIIPAAGAFGTGEHATTAMSLRLLEESARRLPPGWRLLDAGTGTGILALAARQLGAVEVVGLDNDPRAVAHARRNARLNRLRQTKFIAADVLQWKPALRYEIVTANLFSELLIAALPMFRRALKGHGHLIVSGILREQSDSVARALRAAGFRLEKKRRRGKWIAALWRRGASFQLARFNRPAA